MTAPHAAILIVGALCLITAMCVWMIRSNRRHHRQVARRRQGGNTRIAEDEANFSFESDILESIIADHERKLR